MKRGYLCVLAGILLFSGIAVAWQQPEVEYSADSYMETADAVIHGPLYVTRGKERREYLQDGERMVMIIRHDKKVMWMLMPDDKMYMEMKTTEESKKSTDDLSNYKIEQTTVGPEVVNGVNTTKSKIIMAGRKGEKLGGFWWQTKEGIIAKMDVIAVDKGSKNRIKSELKNLKVGNQDPRLFEIPSGYSKMSMGDFGKMIGGDDEDGEEQP
jgi:hypothetical protein